MRIAYYFIIAFLCLLNYQAVPKIHSHDAEHPAFVAWPLFSQCLIHRVPCESIRICVTGSGDRTRAEEFVRQSLKLWTEPLTRFENAPRVDVQFDCNRPDGHVVVSPGSGQEFWSGGTVFVYDNSPFGTYLHEFGHAFACIGDTYVNGTAGYCMEGQPHSIMCDGLLRDNLSEDDVTAVRYQYRALK